MEATGLKSGLPSQRRSGAAHRAGVGTAAPIARAAALSPQGAVPQKIGSRQEFAARYNTAGIAKELADATAPATIHTLQRCLPLADAVYGFFTNGEAPATWWASPARTAPSRPRTSGGTLETVPEVSRVAVPTTEDGGEDDDGALGGQGRSDGVGGRPLWFAREQSVGEEDHTVAVRVSVRRRRPRRDGSPGRGRSPRVAAGHRRVRLADGRSGRRGRPGRPRVAAQGLTRPAAQCGKVLLPEPDGPMTAVKVPAPKLKVNSLSAAPDCHLHRRSWPRHRAVPPFPGRPVHWRTQGLPDEYWRL